MNLSLTAAPSFDRARRVSRAVSILSSASMWMIAAAAVAFAGALLFFFDPLRDIIVAKMDEVLKSGELAPAKIPDIQAAMTAMVELSFGKRFTLAAVLALKVAPLLLVLFHLKSLFANFTDGQLFTEENIRRIQMVGIWLVASVIASAIGIFVIGKVLALPGYESDVDFLPLFYGAITYVAAFVMAEGRRISDDNAGIV